MGICYACLSGLPQAHGNLDISSVLTQRDLLETADICRILDEKPKSLQFSQQRRPAFRLMLRSRLRPIYTQGSFTDLAETSIQTAFEPEFRSVPSRLEPPFNQYLACKHGSQFSDRTLQSLSHGESQSSFRGKWLCWECFFLFQKEVETSKEICENACRQALQR